MYGCDCINTDISHLCAYVYLYVCDSPKIRREIMSPIGHDASGEQHSPNGNRDERDLGTAGQLSSRDLLSSAPRLSRFYDEPVTAGILTKNKFASLQCS